jgi:hypothetical protein
MKRAISLLVWLPLMVSGCTRYFLSIQLNKALSSKSPDVISTTVNPQDIYTAVCAKTVNNQGVQNEVNACQNYWVIQLTMHRQTNVTVSANLNGTTNIPMYSASHDGNNCAISFNNSYLITPRRS